MYSFKNNNFIQTCLKFAQARLSPPTFGQLAGIEALKTRGNYFNKVINEYENRRNTLVNELNKIEGVVCPKPEGLSIVSQNFQLITLMIFVNGY